VCGETRGKENWVWSKKKGVTSYHFGGIGGGVGWESGVHKEGEGGFKRSLIGGGEERGAGRLVSEKNFWLIRGGGDVGFRKDGKVY